MQEFKPEKKVRGKKKEEKQKPQPINKKESYIIPKVFGAKPYTPWEEHPGDDDWETFGEGSGENASDEPEVNEALLSTDELRQKRVEKMQKMLFAEPVPEPDDTVLYEDKIHREHQEKLNNAFYALLQKYDSYAAGEEWTDEDTADVLAEEGIEEKDYTEHIPTTKLTQLLKANDFRGLRGAIEKVLPYSDIRHDKRPRSGKGHSMKNAPRGKLERGNRERLRTLFKENAALTYSDQEQQLYNVEDFLDSFAEYLKENHMSNIEQTIDQWEILEESKLNKQIQDYTRWLKTREKPSEQNSMAA